MEVKTTYTGDENEPEILRKTRRFFYIRTRTKIWSSSEGVCRIKTTRRIALGLLEYFLGNRKFQTTILKENERHAIAFFQS